LNSFKEVILGDKWDGKAGGVLKGYRGEVFEKREMFGSGSLAEIAGLKWAEV